MAERPTPSRRRARGFTLLELVVVVIIVAVSAAILLDRMRYYRELAEKAAVEQTLSAIRSGLQLKLAYWLVRGEGRRIAQLMEGNPIGALAEPPANYGGELRGATASIESGMWFYDSALRELVYRPALDSGLRLSSPGDGRLRFRVELTGGAVGRPEAYTGVRLVPVAPFVWDLRPSGS